MYRGRGSVRSKMSLSSYEQRFAVALRCRVARDGVFYNHEILQALNNDSSLFDCNCISNKIRNLVYESEDDFAGDMIQFIEKLRINQIIQDATLKEIEDKIAASLQHTETNTTTRISTNGINENDEIYKPTETVLNTLLSSTLKMISSREIAKNTFQVLKSLYDHGTEHGNTLNDGNGTSRSATKHTKSSPTSKASPTTKSSPITKASPTTIATVQNTRPLSAMALQIKSFKSSLNNATNLCDNESLKSETSNHSPNSDLKRKQSLDNNWVDTKKPKVGVNVPLNSFALNADTMKGIDIVYVSNVPSYVASVLICNKVVQIGVFTNIHEAAKARDLALLRAIGPNNCIDSDLNFSLVSYASTPLIQFTMHDDVLRNQLFGSSWIGVQDCDFSSALVPKGNS